MKKVLCIDDSQLIRNELKKVLEEAGFHFLEAENGQVGLSILDANPDINLIFCDINMPVMNGVEFCRAYSERTQFKHIPVFIMTTEGDLTLKEQAKSYGVKGWILKPFSAIKVNSVLTKLFPPT